MCYHSFSTPRCHFFPIIIYSSENILACTYTTGPILCYENNFLKMKFKLSPAMRVVPLYVSHSLATDSTFIHMCIYRNMNTDPCKNAHIHRQCYIVIFNCSVGSLFPKSCLGNGSVLSYRTGSGNDVYKMVADMKDGKNSKLRSILYSFPAYYNH